MVDRVHDELESIELVQIDTAILDAAANLDLQVRSLDAVDLATAPALGRDLGSVVTYDAADDSWGTRART